MGDDTCPGCKHPVLHAKHFVLGCTVVLDPEPVVGGQYKKLDYQQPGEPVGVRPLKPTELVTTSWGAKNYQLHKCPAASRRRSKRTTN